jgi:putative tryptophan/tyrosine transport system substrate-binding protein
MSGAGMKRRQFIALGGAAAALWPLASRAQQPARMPRVGIMLTVPEADPQSQTQLAAFRAGLEALGWKEGRNIQFEYRWPGGDLGRARVFAAELAGLAPAAIYIGGTIALTAMREATTTIPIVFINVADPVGGGFVASLARPGGNVTGFTPTEYELAGKWLQLLKDMAPGLTRVAMLGDPNFASFRGFQASFEKTATSLSVEPLSLGASSADDIERGIQSFAAQPNGGLILLATATSSIHHDLIVRLVNRHKIPAIYWNRGLVVRGGLMSYGSEVADFARQAATYIDRILKGAKPSDLPVQGPTKFQLVINAVAARAIDLAIPALMLAQADEVIE